MDQDTADKEFILKDGRKLSYRIHTKIELEPSALATMSPQPKLVLYFPGMGFGRLAHPTPIDQVDSLGVQFITIERPGYGKSSPNPQRTLISFANDVESLLTSWFGDPSRMKIYLVAHSAGCPHLLAFCWTYPKWVHRAAIVCPPNPITGAEIPQVRFYSLPHPSTHAFGILAPPHHLIFVSFAFIHSIRRHLEGKYKHS